MIHGLIKPLLENGCDSEEKLEGVVNSNEVIV